MVSAAHLAVNQTEKFMVLLVAEHGLVQLVGKMLQPQTVADRVAADDLLRMRYSLRIGFNSIVDGFFLFSQIILGCHKASRFNYFSGPLLILV